MALVTVRYRLSPHFIITGLITVLALLFRKCGHICAIARLRHSVRYATHNRLFVSMAELRATLRNNICYFQTMRQKVLSLMESPRKARKEAKLAAA
jgi:hypothetical protein